MQRAAFPELQGRPRPPRHRREEKADRVLLGLKIATFFAALGLIGVLVLLVAIWPGQTADSASSQPKLGQSGDDAPREAPTTTTQPTMEPPALRTETAHIEGRPAPAPVTRQPTQSSTTSSKKPPPPGDGFAEIGEPCSPVGAWSVTRDYQPVVCANTRPGGRARWRPVYW